jgi:hypothetical protein
VDDENVFVIPMIRGEHVVDLEDVLDLLDGTGLEWRATDIEVIPREGAALDVDGLEAAVLAAHPAGLPFSDVELRALALQVEQVIVCEILGVPVGSGSGAATRIALEASDGLEWAIRAAPREEWRVDRTSPLFEEPSGT